MGTMLHFRTINQTTEESNKFNMAKSKVETAGKASLGCGQFSVGGAVTNRVTIKEPCYQRQCGAVGVDSSTWCNWCMACSPGARRWPAQLPAPPAEVPAPPALEGPATRPSCRRWSSSKISLILAHRLPASRATSSLVCFFSRFTSRPTPVSVSTSTAAAAPGFVRRAGRRSTRAAAVFTHQRECKSSAFAAPPAAGGGSAPPSQARP
jgi:hypothetical protein